MNGKMILHALTAALLIPLHVGCSLFNKAPMDLLTYKQPDGGHRQLIVFMRGLGGTHRSFEHEGLVSDVRERRLPYDMIAPNAHFGYYWDRSLVQRMKADVIGPAHEAGYEKIWLIGFSMGGLGALMYTIEHPEDVQGICLVAPFLGYKGLYREIEAAGGVRQWEPGAYDPDEDWQRMLWHWLKDNVGAHSARPVYLGYGRADPYVKGQELLARILPDDHVFTVPGGHDYESFKTLWRMFLDSGALTADQSTGGTVTDQP